MAQIEVGRMNIRVWTIAHREQRYPTCGDWWWDAEGNLEVRVSDMGNWISEMAVAIHEIVEALLCKLRGIHEPDVLAFDVMFESERAHGHVPDDAEPGDDHRAPYRREHRFAENVERQFIHEVGEHWVTHDHRVMEL